MIEKNRQINKIVNFFYEMGSLSMVLRGHRQRLLVDDITDNVASHTFQVQIIGYFLARMENVDLDKVVMMCLLHDVGEARSGDQHWVNKQYVKVYEQDVREGQFGQLPFSDELESLVEEYEKRTSKEAIVAKDADTLAGIMYLRQKEWQGNKEAKRWLEELPVLRNSLKTESARMLADELYRQRPCEWQDNVYTPNRRS